MRHKKHVNRCDRICALCASLRLDLKDYLRAELDVSWSVDVGIAYDAGETESSCWTWIARIKVLEIQVWCKVTVAVEYIEYLTAQLQSNCFRDSSPLQKTHVLTRIGQHVVLDHRGRGTKKSLWISVISPVSRICNVSRRRSFKVRRLCKSSTAHQLKN